MSVTKSNNNMGGAYGNLKKENELLKKKAVVSESNQNGIRLIMNETGDFKNIVMASVTPFRYPVSEVETVITTEPDEEEEDEELIIMREMNQRLKEARMRKMRKDTKPLQDEQLAINAVKKTDIMKKIKALEAEYEKMEAENAFIKSGGMDEELIKRKTVEVKITPTAKPASVPPKPEGTRARATINRPSDIFALFTTHALIKIKMNEKEYFGKVLPEQKLIKACKADGTFNHMTDKGVISHLTKTIKIEGGKTKDVPDESEPAKERKEWEKKDDWIKACKGEQGLYSSTKNGWKEISFYDTKKKEWICLLETAYEGVKLN